MSRLLVIACSEKKLPGAGSMPAVERYDGPAFRVLRKYLRGASAEVPTVLILSAKYGLIPSDRAIGDYDCRLSKSSAAELRPEVLETLGSVLRSKRWNSVAVCAGKDYRLALDGFVRLVPSSTRLEMLAGGLGTRLTNLKNWLHGGA
jgi:hypothetical protein